jgi:tight adherence protein B
MDIEAIGISAVVGVAVAGIAYFGNDYYARAIDFLEKDLGERLRTMRASTRMLRPLLHAWLGAIVAALIGFSIGMESVPFGVLSAALLLGGPWYLVSRMARRRRQKIEDQLADAMVAFSSGIKAGMSIAQALGLLAKDCPRPIREEFQQIVAEYQLGKPLEITLEEAKNRLKSENFVLFSAALMASRESGGKLNETVERISSAVREMQRLERKVQSETAQARKSAVYMAIVPVIILIVFSQVDPENTSLLFTTLPGQLMLASAILLNVVAYFWASRILRADI